MMNRADDCRSMTAATMGAKIDITGPPRALYLVIGNNSPIESSVTHVGGHITMRFTESKLLAVLSYDGFLALKKDPVVLRIGPVNLDMERFKKVSQIFSKAVAPVSGTA